MKNASGWELVVLAAGLAFGGGCGPATLPSDDIADLPDSGVVSSLEACCRNENAPGEQRDLCVVEGLRGSGYCGHIQRYYADACAGGDAR
jgi:hypothetical protein